MYDHRHTKTDRNSMRYSFRTKICLPNERWEDGAYTSNSSTITSENGKIYPNRKQLFSVMTGGGELS